MDTLIKHTDALYLPGDIGIAHTRPGGSAETWGCAHPFITYGEEMACVTNGTDRGTNVKESVAKVRLMLDGLGYKFRGECFAQLAPRQRLEQSTERISRPQDSHSLTTRLER